MNPLVEHARRPFRARGPRLVAWLLSWALLLLAGPAGATVTITDTDRSGTVPQSPFQWDVNLAACQGADTLTFTVAIVPDTTAPQFEVWVGEGVDCSLFDNRDEDGTCVQIGASETRDRNESFSYELPLATIAASLSGVSGCDDTSGVTGLRPVSIYFLQVGSGGVDATSSFVWDQTRVDLVGPRPPTNLTIGAADSTVLLVSFDESPDAPGDVNGYVAYCDTTQTGGTGGASTTVTTATTTTVASSSSSTAAATTGAGGAGGFGGAGGAVGGAGGTTPGAGGTPGVGGTTSSSTTAASTVASTVSTASAGGADGGTCSSNLLTAGQLPSTAFACSEQTAPTATEVQVNVSAGAFTVVGVVAVDELGNTGNLSELACGFPEDVIDFFEQYKAAGGTAGGGFCNCSLVGTSPRHSLAALLWLGAAALAWRRRRGGER